ncbi:hypothetical protein CI238_10990 [Colletotrichum incanum]|uniref:Uncharacterized protein n=1 Tax=Colletotrichum incanum TaxID=1573173 RepID=A0A162N3W8_COLIC|nr:hypothetical protein CI238_10990 [Colletotrichum incanum]
MSAKADLPNLASSATTFRTSQSFYASQPATSQVAAQIAPLPGLASASTSTASPSKDFQFQGNAKLLTDLQSASRDQPLSASNLNQSTGGSILKQPQYQAAGNIPSLSRDVTVACQPVPSPDPVVSTRLSKVQAPTVGGTSEPVSAPNPFSGMKNNDEFLFRPLGHTNALSPQLNSPFATGAVPADGGASIVSGRFFSDTSTQATAFTVPVINNYDVPKKTFATGASPESPVVTAGTAETQGASPSTPKFDNRAGAHPTLKESTHTVKTENGICIATTIAPQTVVILTPDDREDREMEQSAQEAHDLEVERLSAYLVNDLRPILRKYLRDKLAIATQNAATHMQQKMRSSMGLQDNAHFGFAILRDVEAKTPESMANETSALFEGVFFQAADAINDTADQKYKRVLDNIKEESAAEDDRAAKRPKTTRRA